MTRAGGSTPGRVVLCPGGPMLLHASRLVVPRGGKSPIDVTAPLPDHWSEWADLVPQAVVPAEEVLPPSTELETGATGTTPAEPSAGDEA